MMLKDDSILMLAAFGFAIGGYWLWNRNQQTSSIQQDNSSPLDYGFLTGIGDSVTKTLSTMWTPPKEAAPYLSAIRAAEQANGLPANMLARLLHQESRYRADIISGKTKSPVGAIGIAQFMPATAKEFGINPLDPFQSIAAAGRYLKQLYNRFGSWDKALASYNWGQGNVSRKGLARAPTETRLYFTQILTDIGLA